MFTGLIQETGRVVSFDRGVSSDDAGHNVARVTVAAGQVPAQLARGDSVAVSGVCLTAVEIHDGHFSADLAEETLQRTSLGQLRPGTLVNLELPARAQDRLGGHVVQGHVDGVGRVLTLEEIKERRDWRLAIEIPAPLARYVVPQGSITVEGISLTIASMDANRVEIAVIPHTYAVTNLHALHPGDPVNIEVDVLARYAEKMAARNPPEELILDELIRNGF